MRIVTNTECHEGPLVDFRNECEHFMHLFMTGEPNVQSFFFGYKIITKLSTIFKTMVISIISVIPVHVEDDLLPLLYFCAVLET